MIVRAAGDRLHLITQPDHARLARRIMERCASLLSHPRRDTILHAIEEHDNGWAEEDAAPEVDPRTGEIFDFVRAPFDVRHRVWPRAVGRLAADPWAAALVAQHALTVYGRFESDPAWAPFFERMASLRDGLLRVTDRPFDELRGDYLFVRLGDLISLTFCNAWTDEQRFDRFTVRLSGAVVVVSPDPFGGEAIAIEVEAQEIQNQRFASNRELAEALRQAPAVTLRGDVTGAR